MHPQEETGITVVTVKVGSLGSWHAVHILLSLLTGGFWLVVYGAHAIVAAINRPTITVEVPAGARVEYHRGYPNVLMPDEYLDVPSHRHARTILIAVCVLLAGVMAIIGIVTFA